MSINIPESILELKGQCVNTINCNEYTNTITISCSRDKRFTPIDPVTYTHIFIHKFKKFLYPSSILIKEGYAGRKKLGYRRNKNSAFWR